MVFSNDHQLRRNSMTMKYLAAALLTTALLTGTAAAQTAAPSGDRPAASAGQRDGWRASKLAGVDVYNEANEKIGDINDVIIDKSGKVAHVILGVGGFLGMGEHYVAVGYDKLKWVTEPARSTSASNTTAPANRTDNNARASDGTAKSTTTGSASARTSDAWYPDHVVFNATKEQLKAMPQFSYDK
jgi:sporulation protein YlmC with PRC-barrel domain